MTSLGLRYCAWAFSSCREQVLLLDVGMGPQQLRHVSSRDWGHMGSSQTRDQTMSPALAGGFFFLLYLIYLVLAVLGLHCCKWAFSSCGEWGLLSSCSARPSHCGGFSCCRAQALEQSSVAVLHKLSCPQACGILSNQEWHPCPLYWQESS